ncbi:MAG: succinate dehydrogenase, hydrophobic membrane anchor protein [Gammaproteobacteria bacterium]
MSRRTPLSRVLGLGSAKEGTDHFWVQRVTAVAVAILGTWFAFSLGGMMADGVLYRDVIAWMASPVRAAALLAFVVSLAWHSMLGVQTVIEDYLHGGTKVVLLILQKFVHIGAALAACVAILRVALAA